MRRIPKYFAAATVLLAFLVAVFACSVAMAEDIGAGGANGITEGIQTSSAVNAAGVVSADLSFPLGFKLIFGIDADPTTPSLSFEPGTGCWGQADGVVYCGTNTAARWGWNGSFMFGLAANTWGLNNVSASATVPTMSPRGGNGGDNDSGLGGSADGEVSVISDGVEKLTVNGTGISTPCTTVNLGVGATTWAVNSACMLVNGHALANVVATITAGDNGSFLRILFSDALVVITDTDAHTASTIDLNSAFTSADDKVLYLVSDGTSWYEIGRSAN